MRITSAVAALVVVAAGLIGFGSLGASPASANSGDCIRGELVNVDNKLEYVCYEWSGGSESGGGGGGVESPTCTLDERYKDLCIGQDACWWNNPAAVQEPEELEGVPKPNEDSHVVYISCLRPDGSEYDRWYWSDDVPVVTMEDRMRSAMGALTLPTISATFNPPTRTLVNLDTWWWAEGAPAGEIRGSAALGLVAFATPRGMTVDPGDGTGAISCPLTVSHSDACSHTYRRGGDFTATMSIVYDIRFEMGGTVLDSSTIPADLRSITVDDSVTVPVREVQSIVTGIH